MGWEETARELQPKIERKREIERRVLENPGHFSSSDQREWRELSNQIASLTFKRDWEFEQDVFAVERVK
jgi:hypothetical protein